MAQIEKLLISASTEEAFLQSLAAQEIPDYAIVFIEDTNKIYAKGVYYPCPYTKEELDAKFEECNENIETFINSLKGSNNGLASLDSTGKVPASQLPSYVDDVLEYNNRSGFPGTGESGKIYIAKDTNLTYRWSGSTYVEISQSLALGETSSTAYPGNKGKQNADNIASLQSKTTNIDNYTVNGKKISTNPTISKGDVGLGNVNNTSDANKPISTATQNALNQKQNTLVSGTNIKTINGTSILGSGNLEIQSGIQSIPTATAGSIGGIKIGFTESGKNYPVELSSGGQAFVNVPWTDTNTTYNNATTSTAGLMSAADKTKLEGIATEANKYVHPTTSGNKHIPAGGSSGQILRWASDGTAQWGNDNNTTYSVATSSSNGLMSSTDKAKLDGIASGANKTTVDSTLSSSSTNPVQNKVINSALAGKANTSHTHTASQVTGLASVATSGSYNDLSNKPAIPSAYTLPTATSSRLGGVKVGAGLSVAGDGTLSVSSGGVADSVEWNNVVGKPSSFTPSSHTHPSSQITGLTASRALVSDSSGHPAVSTVTSTELGYLDGVTSSIQTQLNGKAASTHTHNGTQISGLTVNRALVSSSLGNILASSVTSTELGYLDGVTSKIQTQLDSKINTNLSNLNVSSDLVISTNQLGVNVGVSGNYWNKIPKVSEDGVMEIGKYIDFHVSASDSTDYNIRFTVDDNATTSSKYTIKLPHTTTSNGTLYLTARNSQNVWTAYQDFQGGAGNSGSDMRFKSEVENVNSTLDDINKINVIKYIWEHPDEKDVKYTFGVNADELINLGGIYATMVHHRQDNYDTKWIEYDRFGVLAIKGLQELNKKLEDKCAKYEKIISVLADKCGVNVDEL